MKIESTRPNHPDIGRFKPLTLALVLASSAHAVSPVAINNAGFEAPVTADGTYTPTATGWSNFNTATEIGVINPDTGDFTAEAPEGVNLGYVYGGVVDAGLSQVLTATLLADATYSLSVKVGNSISYAYDGYRVQLLAGGTPLAEDNNTLSPAADAFVTSTVNYVYNAGLHAGLVGQPLEIRLLGKGQSGGSEGETEFEDVQLTVALANPIAVAGGPYPVFVGGSLLLNGSASLPSDGATITTYEWDLDDDGDYDEAITGSNPAAISQADLVSVHGMALGGNTIKLRVTDSAAKTSVSTTAVNILPATAVVYEPFNYTGTALNGASGTTEVGLTGTWTSNTNPTLGGNLSFGPLVTRGAGIATGTGSNTFGGTRSVNASALAGNGLLTDGSTLWFSMILGYNTGGNLTNSRLGFALANSQFNAANFKYWVNDEGAQVGSGLGVTLGRIGGVNGKVVATQFRDDNAPVANPTNGFDGNVFGTIPATAFYTAGGQFGLIVGKITWGANDTIELYRANADLTLPATPFSTLTVSVDQTTYDTITWARGDAMLMDEIRFGASYQAVIETGSHWDLNADTAGAGGATPAGTWDTGTKWNLAADGTLVPIPWQAGGVATFAAGNDATGAYSITVDGTQDIGGLVVEEGTVTIGGGTGLRMTKDTTVSVATGLSATVSSPFTEDAPGRQFAKAGGGTLVLSGDNSGATSGMNLAAGVTQFESASAINGTARNVTISSGGVMMLGSGFGAGNIPAALLNRVTVASSGVIAADNYASTDFDFNTAGLTAARLGAVGNLSYTGTLTPQGTTYRLGGGGGTLTMANLNALTGANAVVINGNVILASDNNYTGTTSIGAGYNVSLLGANTTSAVSLDAPNTVLTLGNNAALGSGTFTMINSFAGTSTIQAQGTVVTTNPVTVSSGGFTVAGTGALTLGTITLSNTATITNNNTTTTTTIAAITAAGGTRPITFAGNGNTTVTGAIGGGTNITTISKGGTGVLSLNSANTHTGSTTVTGGVLLLNDANAVPGGIGSTGGTSAMIINGGVFGLGTGDFSRPLGTNATVTAVNFTGNGGWAAYGADRLVNLDGASVAWGTANTGLNGKNLILSHASATHMVTLQNPLDLGTAARTVQVDNGAAAIDATLSGTLSGTGALTKTGAGTLALTGSNTRTGGTNVNGGTLAINGPLADATMTIATGATVNGSGTLTFNIDGTTFDQIVVNGTINLTGLSAAVNATGAGLTEAEYVLVNATSGTITGTFAGLTGAPGYTLNYATPNQVKLVTIGGSPYTTWSGGAAADIDTNGDGVDNGVAWALGAADPNANAIGLLPTLDNTSDPTYVRFLFNRSDAAEADVNTDITVQYGSDLVGWTTAVDDNDNVEIEVTDGSPNDAVVVKLKRSTLATGGKIFARLNVVVTP